MATEVRSGSIEEIAGELAQISAAGQAVRIVGAATKLSWGSAPAAEHVLHTGGLNRIREHNYGDLTAVLEAGVPLAQAQETFAAAGQMLALDPWLGSDRQATVGGVLATADSGPLSHRYGAPRDLVLGMTVVLADGTVARSGGQVIKNVAGYDVAKLFCGSFGTLGLIATVNVRLHPRPEATITAAGHAEDPDVLARAAAALAAAPLELEALDVAWEESRGRLLARCGGATAHARIHRAVELMRQAGLREIVAIDPDEELWEAQRAGQRSQRDAVIRVAAPPVALAELLRAAQGTGARLVGRAALGLSYLAVDPGAFERLLALLPEGTAWSLLDAPEALRDTTDPWGPRPADPVMELMSRLKARFDPTRACNPGLFVGGI
jgi:glycolate oxidase FAD binding subunit